MKYILHTILFIMSAFCAGMLFYTSQSVQKAERALNRAQHVQHTERERLHVLTSEWDYLNAPQRLEELVADHLSLQPVQLAERSLDELPVILPDDSTLPSGAGVMMAEGETVPATPDQTGGPQGGQVYLTGGAQ